jgi:hypothetical protein
MRGGERREEGRCGRRGGGSVHAQKLVFLRRSIACENEKRNVEKESMYEEGKTSSTHPMLGAPCCCFLTVLLQEEELWMEF